MRKKSFFLWLLLSATLVFAFNINQPLNYMPDEPDRVWMTGPYDDLWEKVDSLEKKGLTKSALEVVDQIYLLAEKEGNHAQRVKSLIHIFKYTQYVEEEALVKNLTRLRNETEKADGELAAILHSIQAETFWTYFTNNRWKFYDRTEMAAPETNDIRTWDLPHLLREVVSEHEASLADAQMLKKVPVSKYDEIIVKQDEEAREYRPTLYDFLAHRALDFYMNQEAGLPEPKYKFYITGEEAFAGPASFIRQEFQTKDTASLDWHAMTLLQDLTAYHLKDKDPGALLDVDLKRLRFVRENSTLGYADSLYLRSLKNLAKDYEDHPTVANVWFQIASQLNEEGNSWQPYGDESKRWKKKEAAEICRRTIDKFPGTRGARNCEALLHNMKLQSSEIQVEKINFINKPFRASVQYQNIDQLSIRIINIDTDDPNEFYGMKQEDVVSNLLKRKPVHEWVQELPLPDDYQTHRTEIAIPALPQGKYIILTSVDPDYSLTQNQFRVATTWVSNIGWLSQTDYESGNEFFFSDRKTGEPLKNASVQVKMREYNYSKSRYEYKDGKKYTTDENGFILIPPPASNSVTYSLEVKHGDDNIWTYDTYYQYRYNPQDPQWRPSVILFTDRSIYRPGQTIYFKGIVLDRKGEESRLKTDFPVNIEFKDVNYQKIADLNVRSNEYGTFEGTFTAPQGVLTGAMTLYTVYGQHQISVEEYKRPKFEVKFEPVKGSYKLNETVTVEGEAKAYTGSAVDGAEVRYRVVRNVSYPWWGGWYRWWLPPSSPMEIAFGTTQTDESGKFKVNFELQPDPTVDPKMQPKFTYTVYADVVDITGETRSAQTYVSASYIALDVSVSLHDRLNKDETQWIGIRTKNMSGEFEPASGEITIWRLDAPDKVLRDRLWSRPDQFVMTEAEFKSKFPTDIYDDENNVATWPKSLKALETSFNTAEDDSLKLAGLQKWKDGKYVMELTTKDKSGQEIKVVKYFTLYSEKSENVPLPEPWFYDVERKVYHPGDEVKVKVGSAYQNVWLRFEMMMGKETVREEWIRLNDEKKTITIPVTEIHRGNFAYNLFFIKDGRQYTFSDNVSVPWDNKDLKIELMTWRDKIRPGDEEKWTIKVSGPEGEQVAAEMVASMYDASLDAFKYHGWSVPSVWPYRYNYSRWTGSQAFAVESGRAYAFQMPYSKGYDLLSYDYLNRFGWYPYDYYYGYFAEGEAATGGAMDDFDAGGGEELEEAPAPEPKAAKEKSEIQADATTVSRNLSDEEPGMVEQTGEDGKDKTNGLTEGEGEPQIRKNLQETAFFFPMLETNEKGEILITFTAPEALTKWKFMALAHTKDLKFGYLQEEIVTQKELMVLPNIPRFFRENDDMVLTAKVSNLSDKSLTGTATLELFDALTMKPVNDRFGNKQVEVTWTAEAGRSALLEWDLHIPQEVSAVVYRIVAKAGNFSDGEEAALPVLTNRMLVTESMPLPVRAKEEKTFTFDKLATYTSSTLDHHKYTLEFTSNPAWYAIQALPYLMEYPYECTEQTFSRLYANAIASHIANSHPKIKQVFDTWKNYQPEALLSNLEKNQELKALLLEETPWVLNAQNESERKKRVALLFDLHRMANEKDRSIKKLKKAQVSNGAWPWFEGGPENRYMTQHIICGFGKLAKLGVKDLSDNSDIQQMALNAMRYLDNEIADDYDYLRKHKEIDMEKYHPSYIQIHYLYMRSFFPELKHSKMSEAAMFYFLGQVKKYWLDYNRYLQGMIAISVHRHDEGSEVDDDIIKSLKENAIYHEELGMYWKSNTGGWYWYQAPIETQALLIEAFDEVANDQESVEEMKLWLLKNKQTNDWKTTKATVEACYALLMKGTQWLAESEIAEIRVGNKLIDPAQMPDVKVEAGTGYFKTSWDGSEIDREMAVVKVKNKNEVAAWGAVYWQYFEQLDKITPHETPLKLEKELFIQENTETGPKLIPITEEKVLKPGDLVKVRVVLRTDRDMEYVHLKDMRAACFEPVNVLSGYRWQGGLGYYESTRDAATNFFIHWLPKGTYVFEYPVRVTHVGDFSNGISSIQCMYAPEFTAHSEGIRVTVK